MAEVPSYRVSGALGSVTECNDPVWRRRTTRRAWRLCTDTTTLPALHTEVRRHRKTRCLVQYWASIPTTCKRRVTTLSACRDARVAKRDIQVVSLSYLETNSDILLPSSQIFGSADAIFRLRGARNP